MIVKRLEFNAYVSPEASHHTRDALLALEDIVFAINRGVSEAWLESYCTTPTAKIMNNQATEDRLDVSLYEAIYDAKTADTRSINEHSLAIVGNDIFVPGLNYLFGITYPLYRASVVSSTRIDAATSDTKLASSAVRVLARHEVGHQFGLKGVFEEDAGSNPLHDYHCNEPCCTMKQVLHPGELFDLVESQESQTHFCDDCSEDLAVVALRRVATINGIPTS